MHPCTPLGTPTTVPAHPTRRVYTDHARSALPTLDHHVTELNISDVLLTVVTEQCVTVRQCCCSLRNV